MSGIYCMNDKCRMADGQMLVSADEVYLTFRCAYCGAKQKMDIDRYNELVNSAFVEEEEE